MYQRVLAPLDGSELAECSLAHVTAIASGCNVPEVVLMRVVEPMSTEELSAYAEAGGNLLARAEAERESDAETYLARTSDKMKAAGLNVKAVLTHGKAAEIILDYATKNNVDLIIMSTHGRSGVSRWVFGSVAEKVVRHSTVPVLTIAPPGCRVAGKD